MRISRVIAVNSQTKKKETFVFGNAPTGLPIFSDDLVSYIEFCFGGESEFPLYVEVSFLCDEKEYAYSRLLGADGKVSTFLKFDSQTLKNDEADGYLRNILVDLKPAISEVCVSRGIIDGFDGDLSQFPKLRAYLNTRKQIENCIADIRRGTAETTKKVAERKISEAATEEQLKRTAADILSTADNVEKIVNDFSAGDSCEDSKVVAEIVKKMRITQHRLDVLSQYDEQATAIERKAEQVACAEEYARKKAATEKARSEADELEKNCAACASDMEWKQKEYRHICDELSAKKVQFDTLKDKKFRVDGINAELSVISQLINQNKQLSALTDELSAKKQKYSDERAECVKKIADLKKRLEEMKPQSEITLSTVSMGDILESARIDVKIEEVESQLAKLQGEIEANENRIAEKESGLTLQKKRFRSVVELDSAVSPIKAKDTILQVLNAKYSKLQTINSSLEQKQRNLNRALEDYRYKISQLEMSRDKLIAEKNKALLRKQEEFKREVFVNSQKVFSDDASGVFAVTANFRDEEILLLEQQIANRESQRDEFLKMASEIEGAIREIKRNIEINAAEMETLNGEKSNINRRYNEIVAENSSETVFNYLKAIHNDGGTQYLLDIQQTAVSAETELAELKKYTDMLKQKAAALKTRLKNLRETKTQLGEVSSVDSFVSSNDKLKDSLTDFEYGMSTCYEAFVETCRQIEEIDAKSENINAAFAQAKKTLKVNESQIKAAYERAKRYAESDDLQKALTELGYEISDVESELRALEMSEKELSEQVFEARLQSEKAKWLFESKRAEYVRLNEDSEKMSTEFDGVNLSETEAEQKKLAKFRSLKERLKQRLVVYSEVLNVYNTEMPKSFADSDEPQREVAASEAGTDSQSQTERLQSLISEQKKLGILQQKQLLDFFAANLEKMKLTAAAAELNTLKNLRQMSLHFNVVLLFIADKISTELQKISKRASEISGSQLNLKEQNGFVRVCDDKGVSEFGALPQDVKSAIYIALLLDGNNAAEKTLVLGENVLPSSAASVFLGADGNIQFAVKHFSAQVK